MKRTLGVIGGSGIYDVPGIGDVEEIRVETPFGEPSDAIVPRVNLVTEYYNNS